jgi:hypothetical protein
VRIKTTVLAAAGLAAIAVPLLAWQETKKAEQEPEKKESRTAYLRRMFATDRCTFGDGVRFVAGLAAGEHVEGDHATILAGLVGKDIVPKDWKLAEGSKLTKGTLGFLLCKTLGIKGGVTMRLTGTSRRYALRECVFLGIMTAGSTDEYVSGRELIDTMQRAAIYKTDGSLDKIRK